jgi:hypothetical protein
LNFSIILILVPIFPIPRRAFPAAAANRPKQAVSTGRAALPTLAE